MTTTAARNHLLFVLGQIEMAREEFEAEVPGPVGAHAAPSCWLPPNAAPALALTLDEGEHGLTSWFAASAVLTLVEGVWVLRAPSAIA